MQRGIQREELDEIHLALPSWFGGRAIALVPIALALVSFLIGVAHGGWTRPGLVATCLLVAVAPYLATLVTDVSSLGWVVMTLASLSILQVGGAVWGWSPPGHPGLEQTSFLVSFWVVIDAAIARPRWTSRLVCLWIAVTVILYGLAFDSAVTPIWLAGLLFAYVAGLLLHTLGLTIAKLRQAEGRVAREAVAAEQRRIAREVHDIVAHSLAVTALHLSAARMANDRGDLAGTGEALADAERLNRASLADLRQTVRLLRPADEHHLGTEASLPGMEQLDEVVGTARTAGLDVHLTVGGDVARVDPTNGLTALRVVQEALTNAVRHQVDAATTVEVAVGEDLVVTVTSIGPHRSSGSVGMGLIGMRERVETSGGHLDVGPLDDGWRVEAHLPLTRDAALTDGREPRAEALPTAP